MLEQTINNDIKAAMLARESQKLNALRAVKSAILLAKTQKGGGADLDADHVVCDVDAEGVGHDQRLEEHLS